MTEYTATCEVAGCDRVRASRTPVRVYLTPFSDDGEGPSVYLPPDAARTFARGILALADEIDGGEAPEPTPRKVKVGDKLRVMEDGLYDAEVFVGDVLTVEYVYDNGGTFYTEGDEWVFNARHIGNGLEFVDETPPSAKPADEPIKVGDRVTIVREYPSRRSDEDGRPGTIIRLDSVDEIYPYHVETVSRPHGVWVHEVRRAVVDDESAPAEEPALKIGDRVVVLETDEEWTSYVGRVGELGQIDSDSVPYYVRFDDGDALYVIRVRKVDEPAPAPSPSSAYSERLAALKEAQRLVAYGPCDESPLAVARFLLGE